MIGWKTYVGVRLLIGALHLCLSVGCQPRMEVQPTASAESVRGEALQAYLSDPRLLNKLDVNRLRVLESHGDWAAIGADNESDPLGKVYYTIQDGWHLKADNERMEYVPGKGWLIAEEDQSRNGSETNPK